MTMKRIRIVVAVCASVAAPALADPAPNIYTHGQGYDGGQVLFSTSPYGGTNGGGEFTVRSDGGRGLLLGTSAYVYGTTAGLGGYPESFQTFCVERDEYVYPGQAWEIWVSESSAGSPDAYGSGSHAWRGGIGTDIGDDLDPKTAWLYTQFATGQLDEYRYAGTTAQRTADAAQLQIAIWHVEGEWADLGTGKALGWYNGAVAAGWSDIHGVRVLQGYVSGDYRQDMLYLVPLPATVLLGMLGLGAAGLKLREYT